MNADWLVIRPVFDEVTEITFDEAEYFIDYLKEKGVSWIDLAKKEAIVENVEEVLVENPTISIYHADHGSTDKIYGNDNRPVINLKNVHLLEDKEIFNNNCSSAKKLGVEAWKKGCKAFFGYTDVFMFTTDALEEFKIATTYAPKLRVDGHSLKECLEKTKEKMIELRDLLIKAGKALAAACMTRDQEILVCYNADPPEEADCWFRRQAIRLFGSNIGWKLTRRFLLAVLLFGVGYGVALGKLTHTLWEIGGLENVFAPQGDYVGYILMLIGFLMVIWRHIQTLRKKSILR